MSRYIMFRSYIYIILPRPRCYLFLMYHLSLVSLNLFYLQTYTNGKRNELYQLTRFSSLFKHYYLNAMICQLISHLSHYWNTIKVEDDGFYSLPRPSTPLPVTLLSLGGCYKLSLRGCYKLSLSLEGLLQIVFFVLLEWYSSNTRHSITSPPYDDLEFDLCR